jgi:hypothetical protein
MMHFVVGQGRYVRQVKVPFWALMLIGAGAALFAFLLLAFLASFALFAIPAIVIGAAAARLLGHAGRNADGAYEPIFTRNRHSDPNIIEGEYRVIGEKERR